MPRVGDPYPHDREPAEGCVPARSLRALRGSLVPLGIAVALPSAFATTQAAASDRSQPGTCTYNPTLTVDNGVVESGDGCGCTPCWPRPRGCWDTA